jgi:Tfp pilus assembly protein PilO
MTSGVLISVLAIFLVNLIGWIFTYLKMIKDYGRLTQKVDDLDKTIHNGLLDKVDGISRHLAHLEGYLNSKRDEDVS